MRCGDIARTCEAGVNLFIISEVYMQIFFGFLLSLELYSLFNIVHKAIYDNNYPSYTNKNVTRPTRAARSAKSIDLNVTYHPRLSTVGGKSVYVQASKA